MRYILKLITRFKEYENKGICIFGFFLVICLIGANFFCATKIRDVGVEDYIMANLLTFSFVSLTGVITSIISGE